MSDDDRAVLWAYVGALSVFKVVTSIFILYYFPSWHTLLFVIALSVMWFAVPVYYVVRNPRGRYRLFRARIRRNELLRQEWEVEEPSARHRT